MTDETLAAASSPRSEAALAPPLRDEPLDVRQVIAVIVRRAPLVAVIMVAVFALALAALFTTKPTYTATSQVVIEARAQRVIDMEQVTGEVARDNPTIDTEVEVLRSPLLAQRVVKALELDKDPEFNPALEKPGLLSGLKKLVSGAGPTGATPTREQVQAAVARRLLANLQARRVGLTYAINISFSSRSPETAAKVANAFAEQYLANQLDTKYEATQRASAWLNSRLAGLRTQVETAEAAVQHYRAANGLLASAQGETLTQQQISGLSSQLASARADQAEQEARLNAARQQMRGGQLGEDLGAALSSAVITRLRDQRAQTSREVVDLQGRYGERHPDLQRAQRQLADIDSQIQGEVRRIMSNLEAQVQISRQRTASIESSLGAQRGTLSANATAQVRLNELERNAESARTLYQSFLDRFKQTTAQQGIEQSDARIGAMAAAPRAPSAPKPALYIVGGLIAAVLAAAVAVIIAELFDNGVTSEVNLEHRLNVPSLGAIADLGTLPTTERTGIGKLSPASFVMEKPLSSFAESFRSLAANLKFTQEGRPAQVLAVSSALPGEGKTTTALCLARSIAQSGETVILVDCDLRRRAKSGQPENAPTAGLREVLEGKATLQQAVVKDAHSNAYRLPRSAADREVAADLLGGTEMDKVIEDLRQHFSVIILDTAPVLAIAETRVLATKVDGVLFLVRWRRTPHQAAGIALKNLQSVGANVIGAALTQVDMREQRRTAFGDAGYYYDKYSSYYS
ncbi:GumC family protein [Caulobacter endophyticus]|uniref:GumC family protein n=1 Tax=Caulobacter endophyticus TaxID=2172652 RepID=UPI00240FF901|nr:polysaccharide biosynthesis tyrosine autokinase [Caulobacter endophyticus]MDG2531898.1 polysaccharide biosynthesis tyrosine autokinase [Caulobacter endophyticus]